MIRNLMLSGTAAILFLISAVLSLSACATPVSNPDRGTRAYGVHPDWILTLRPDHWMTLETGYDGERYALQIPTPKKHDDTLTYHAKGDGVDVTLVLAKKTCMDATGEQQPYTATVTANGKTLHGCAHKI